MRLTITTILAASVLSWACDDGAEQQVGVSQVGASQVVTTSQASDPAITALLPLAVVNAETENVSCSSSRSHVDVYRWSGDHESGQVAILAAWSLDGRLRYITAGYGTHNWFIRYLGSPGNPVVKSTSTRGIMTASVILPPSGAESQHLEKLATLVREFPCQTASK